MAAEKLLSEDFLSKLDQLQLVSRKIVAGALKGDRLSRRRGHSTELADFRNYVVGDDLRFVDWNAFARLDKLFLKLFLEEEDLQLKILIDRSPSMDFGDPNKLTYARKIAAALGYVGLVNQDRVQVAAFADVSSPVFGPARGRRQAGRLLELMDGLAAEEEASTSLARACRELSIGGRRGGIVVLVSDLLDRAGFEQGLSYLLAGQRSTEVYVFHVLAPEELEPTLRGDLRLVDREDGSAVEVSVSASLLKGYRRTLDAFRSEAQEYCSRHGLHYIFTSTAVPFDRLVLEYLRRRGLVK